MSTDNSPGKDSHRNLIRSTSIISAGTLSSRILGFFRDIILARLLGTGFMADSFFVAFRIPNLFRDLVGEGATNSAFVPIFSEYVHQKDKQALWNFTSVIFVIGLILLSVLTILGILLAPLIVRVIAPGFIFDTDKLIMTIQLTKLMFPYLILIGLTAYCMAILYTFRSFVTPAFAPCLLNISLIVSALFASRTMKEPVFGLAIGVLVGGLLQLLVHIKPVFQTGVRFVRPKTLNHPGARRVGRLLIPRLFGAGVYQLTVLVDTFCASLSFIVGAGGISAIYYSNRIIQFPMGIFTVALASAVLPTLSGYAAQKNFDQLKRTLVFSLENIFFVMFPTSVMIMILSTPIIRILFERGEFDIYSTEITSMALWAYAIGLFSFGGIKIMVTAFHALQDTKTPVIVAAICLVINGALNFILMFPFKVGGIALASSISATIDFFILFYIMDKRLGAMRDGVVKFLTKVFLATVITGEVVYWSWGHLPFTNEIVKLCVVGLFGLIVYGAGCYVLKVEQTHKIYKWVKEFRGKKVKK
jgi:putative peptidoglycan lipid II flippase